MNPPALIGQASVVPLVAVIAEIRHPRRYSQRNLANNGTPSRLTGFLPALSRSRPLHTACKNTLESP